MSTPSYEREVNRVRVIENAIRVHTDVGVHKIANALDRTSRLYKIDWRVMAAILQQESSFQTDPQKCILSSKKCIDLGIAQINWYTWSKPLHLNRRRLLLDVGYNIDVMGKILTIVKKGHEKDKQWYSLYHSFKPSLRKTYESYVTPKYKKIKVYAQNHYYR